MGEPVRLTTSCGPIAERLCITKKKTVTKHGIFRFRPTQISFFAHLKVSQEENFLHFSIQGAFTLRTISILNVVLCLKLLVDTTAADKTDPDRLKHRKFFHIKPSR